MTELRELTQEQHAVAERFWQCFCTTSRSSGTPIRDERGAFRRRRLEPYLRLDRAGRTCPRLRPERRGAAIRPVLAKFWRRLAREIGTNVRERLQPVPDTLHIPDDVILSFGVEA